MSAVAVPDGFAIATPGDWLVFDLEALQDEGEVGAFVDERAAEVPELATHRDEIAATLLRAGRQASAAGVHFAAALATAHEDGAPVVANVTVATLDRESHEALIDEAAGTLEEPIEEHRLGTRLPAGYAARSERVTPVVLSPGTELLTFVVQYLLEVPGSSRDLLAITFSSPAMAYRERLGELFDNLAGTFEWTYSEA